MRKLLIDFKRFAMDRSIDANGHMTVVSSAISKAVVNPYRGREIPNWEALGLNPERVYHLYRDPTELARAASTFENKPLLLTHVAISAEAPARDAWVGVIGAPVTFEAPYLKAPLSVWTAEAITLIESREQEQLSAAYRYRADMTPGVTPDGERFDGVMRDIVANHVALVDTGRAGADVVVGDRAPYSFDRVFPGLSRIRVS